MISPMRRTEGFLAALLALAFGVCAFGCGVKSPPKPPRQNPLPAVTNLSAAREGDTVRLSWRLPEWSGGKAALVGASVYRSKVPAESACRDCPETFEKRGEVPFHPTGTGDRTQTFSESVEPGFRYRYQVVVHADNGERSAPSNRATVEH